MKMETLYKAQCARFDQLQKSKTNYTKDGEGRKTQEYLQKKIAQIETIWKEFIDTDTEMKENLYDDHTAHPYWKERGTFEKFYAKYRNELEAKTKTDPAVPAQNDEYLSIKQPTTIAQFASDLPSLSTIQSSGQARKLKAQDVKLRLCYRLIADAEQLVAAESGNDQLQHKLHQLDARVTQIEQLHEEILVDATPEEEASLPYFTEDHFAVLINNYEILRPKITKLLHNNQSKSRDLEQHEVKLRQIEIPHFHGDPLKWASFYDLFRRTIHENNNISETVKMHQLKTTVLGSAGRIISHLEATGDNYSDAWQLLVNRYQNKRQLVSNHVNVMLSFPVIHSESAAAIKTLHDLLIESLHAIKNLGILTVSWNYIIIPIMMKKLDNETTRLYEMSIADPKEMPTLENFISFLERRFQALEATKAKPIGRSSGASTPHVVRVNTCRTSQPSKNCILCKQGHDLTDCMKFQQQSSLERSKFVAQTQLCHICLKENHISCPYSIRCLVCKGSHNTLLHSNNRPQQAMLSRIKDETSKMEAGENYIMTTHVMNKDENATGTLLATAMVQVQNGKQQSTILRMLVDPGSQISFITEEASKRINLPIKKTYVEIGGINDSEITTATRLVTFRVEPRFSSNFSMEMNALILPSITRSLPEQTFDSRKWRHLNNLMWADPNYNQPNKIDILLGADYYPNILMNQVVKGHQREPIAQQTELGWIIFGNTSNKTPSRIESMVTLTDIDKQLKKFWEIEELQPQKLMTEEEKLCEEHYHKNHSRDTNGRYIVRIPFNPTLSSLGTSKQRALARFLQLERRLSVPSEFSREYQECIDGYFKQGHLIESKEPDDKGYYIPHHAVIKTTSTTTKLRVVFDASAKTSNNVSLNQIQLVGPKLQEDLTSILLRWRKYKVVYTADIEQMYRQIKMHSDDQQYQKILWRTSPDVTIKSYQLTTVTFGMASAPYLALKTLQQLAADEEKIFPIAAKIIRNDFYVDDLLSGSNSLEEAQTAQIQLINLLQTGGFNLRKWASNYSQLVEGVDPGSRAFEPIIFNDESIKTLGLIWNPASDTFEFKVHLTNKNAKMTKRKMLSESSKLFDPLGWLSPTLIQAKILMQTLWISGVTWDQKLPEDLENKCQQYYVSLPKLEEMKIPRWVKFDASSPGELHGFCDASEAAYAAVVYFYDRASNKATLLTSKTRVAPIATKLTLPKLELCGASLLASLMNKVQQDMKFDQPLTYFWTDSMIVLGWVKNKPHKFKTFVANRISEIQKLTSPSQWFYVKSADNPADCASRGIEATLLITHKLWWNGPQIVFKKANERTPMIIEETPDQLELKPCILGATTITSENTFDQLYLKFSSFNTIKRIMAYVLRFIKKCRKLNKAETTWPTAKEMQDATKVLIQLAQTKHFKNEISDIRNKKEVASNSKIKSLAPFLHEGILRLGGRLQQSTAWTYNEKHPMIIPKDHPLTNLLIKAAHEHTLHGGTQLTLAHIRTRYWIIHGRNQTRRFISKCVKCHRFNSKPISQIMGNLPEARITPGRPFLKTGVDYAGPLLIRATKGRGHKAHKGYLSIFVCMTTKAIHIEPVSDLTTDAFIAAYKRFTSRRGLCSDLYSDNGTNFVGANNQLKRELKSVLQGSTKEIWNLLANNGTTWHFIPAASPHFGGLWEAAVKSVKKHLIKVIGEATLTYEELSTVTSQVEACLNSRPLTAMTSDSSDVTFLTPGHFLIGEPLQSIPQNTVIHTNIHGITRWRLVEKIKQDFWKRWHFDYLDHLQHRRKWSTEKPNVEVGDLVLIKDDNIPPLKWLTGRVVEVHPGTDQKVRVVSLRGPGRVLLKRPIHKLVPLPREADNTVDQQSQPKNLVRIPPDRKAKQQRVHHIYTTGLRKHTTIKLVLLIIGIIQGYLTGVKSLINIEPLPSDAGIYFYNTGTVNLISLRWTIIINYNLTGYWENIRAIDQYILYLNESCQKGWEVDNRLKLCDVIIQQLNEQMKEITSQNNLLRTTNKEHSQRKREIGNTVGYILGDAFGIMTQRDASHIEYKLKQAATNEEYLLELIKNQTSIIDATTNIFKHDRELNNIHFRAIAKQFLYLDGRIDRLAADSDHYSRVQAIITFTIQIMLIMKRIAERQRVIIDVILNSHQGHIHPALLTPQQLRDEIQRIHDYAPPTMKIPDGNDDNDLGYIYNLLTVRTRVTANNILFLVKLPLAYTQLYHLYDVIPIPMLENNKIRIITPSTKQLIVDLHREHYAPLTSTDLQRCMQIKPDGYLCDISPIYNTKSKVQSCEINLLKHNNQNPESCTMVTINKTDYWVHLSTNQWIFTVTKPKTVDLICDDQVTTMALKQSGIITLDPRCTLKHEEFYLTAIEEKIHKISSSFTASIRLSNAELSNQLESQTTYIPHHEPGDYKIAQDIMDLEKAITLQKSNEKALPESIESFSNEHHLHHYISIYSLVVIGIILAVVYLCRQRKRQQPPPEDTSQPQRPHPRPRSPNLLAPQYVQSQV